MRRSRNTFLLLALFPVALAGCVGSVPDAPVEPGVQTALPTAHYEARTDMVVLAIPVGAPTRWYTAGFPPTRSARLFPHTPDRELAADLRKQLGKTVLDPLRYEQDVWMPSHADRVSRLLDAQFGSPAAPRVNVPTWEEVVAVANVRYEPGESFGTALKGAKDRLKYWKWNDWKEDWGAAVVAKNELKLDDESLARGSLVYRRACMQCHGPSGAGESAHAVADGPMPRDFRQGVFKYTTTFPPTDEKKKGLGASGKPLRDDLKRTIRVGIDGTIMPAFPTLTEQELDDVVSYVIHLSVRGETELATIAKIIKPSEDDPFFAGGEIDWLLLKNELWVLVNWGIAAKSAITIPPEPFASGDERIKSAVRGFKLYNSADFGCASCHADYGRSPQLKWDAWGTVVQPRNLTLGVYRGGRRGQDLYARIHGGIVPSGMTAFQDRLAKTPPGAPDPIWDIVHFLQALGDPRDRRRMQELDTEVKFEQ